MNRIKKNSNVAIIDNDFWLFFNPMIIKENNFCLNFLNISLVTLSESFLVVTLIYIQSLFSRQHWLPQGQRNFGQTFGLSLRQISMLSFTIDRLGYSLVGHLELLFLLLFLIKSGIRSRQSLSFSHFQYFNLKCLYYWGKYLVFLP